MTLPTLDGNLRVWILDFGFFCLQKTVWLSSAIMTSPSFHHLLFSFFVFCFLFFVFCFLFFVLLFVVGRFRCVVGFMSPPPLPGAGSVAGHDRHPARRLHCVLWPYRRRRCNVTGTYAVTRGGLAVWRACLCTYGTRVLQ